MADRETVEFSSWDGLLEALPCGVLQIDRDGIVVGANPAAARTLALPPHELLSVRFGDAPLGFVNEAGAAVGFRDVLALAEPGGAEPGRLEVRHSLPRGDCRWISLSSAPLTGGGAVVALGDVTAERAARALLEARSRVVDASPAGNARDLLRVAIDEAEALTGSAAGFCCCFENEEVSTSIRAWSSRATEGGEAPLCRALDGGRLRATEFPDSTPIVIDRREPDDARVEMLPEGVERALVAPVVREGRVVALFVVANKAEAYTARDAEAVRLLGEMAWVRVDQLVAREALRVDEAALESSLSAVAVAGLDGRLRYVNPAFLRLWGLESAAEAVGRSATDFWDDPGAAGSLLQRLQRGEGTIEGDLVARRNDGELRQVRFTASSAVDAAGNPIGVLGTFLDVTDRVRQDEALRQNEARLRAIFDAEPECVKLVSREGILLDMNPAGLTMLEVDTPEQAIGKPIIGMVVPEHRESFLALARKVFAGESVIGEFEIVGQRGSRRWMETHAVPLRDEQSEIVCLLAVTRDITARKRVQDALRESEEKLRGLFELSPLGIALTDMDGRYVEFNEAFRRICGYPEDELRHLDYWTLTPHEYEKQEAKQLEALAETGHYGPYEKEYVQKNGRRIPIRLNGMLVSDRAGHRHIWSIVEDISEQRRFEEERRYLEVQLQKSQRLESLAGLAGGVAHDMNNVLAAIESLAGVERDNAPAGSSLRESMDTIIRASERGGALVRGLGGFARAGLAHEKQIDLNAVVRDEAAILERTTLGRVSVRLDLQERLFPVVGDAAALSHALMNLCLNAVEAMPGGGRLTLHTRNAPPSRIVLEVEDTGHGMTPEVQERAFDPFYTTKPHGKGTGLGLAIVYGAVKAHGGEIELESRPGEGTTVSIRLPALDPSAAEPDDEGAARGKASALRVLVVDDDELVQKSTMRVLHAFGHEATIAPCGEDALALLKGGLEVDAVVLDLNMPGIGGVETLGRIRSQWADLPVLLATGRADQAVIDLARATPRVTLLSKPFAPPALNEQLVALVERWPRARR